MAEETHVHTDGGGQNGMGFLLGIIVLVVFVFLFMYYVLPIIRQSSAPQINVPDKIDVNIQQEK